MSRPELSFDFYDYWDFDDEGGEGSGLLGGWGNDELDQLLAGSARGREREDGQPSRQRRMSYGASRGGLKRKTALPSGKDDPTVVPGSSMFGFLERLPWKIGGRGMRYRPSAADLQDNPGGRKWREGGHEEDDGGDGGEEREALLEESEGENKIAATRKGHVRNRSDTATSRSTLNSLSSRGDLFPSEDEDDAVPLDAEFAMVLERRNTSDEASSGKTRGKRPAASRTSTKTESSKEPPRSPGKRKRGASVGSVTVRELDEEPELPSIEALREEEDAVRREEEAEVERKREAAERLAEERGLLREERDLDGIGSGHTNGAKVGEEEGQSTLEIPEPGVLVSSNNDEKPPDDVATSNLDEEAAPDLADSGLTDGKEDDSL